MGCNKFVLAAAPLMLAWLAVATSATADDTVAQPPTGRVTEIDLSSGILYDSNIARLHRYPVPGQVGPSAQAENLVPEDEMFTPDLAVVLARPIGPMMLFLRGDGGYYFHRVNTIRDHAHVQVDGGGSRRIGSCDGSVTGLFGQNQSDLAEYTLGNTPGSTVLALLKNVQTRENVGFTGKCGRSIGLAPSISITQSWLSNSSVVQRGVDNRTFGVNAALGYQQPAFGVVSVFGVYDSSRYPNRDAASLVPGSFGGVSGYKVYAGGLRYERHIGLRLDAVASVSYTSLASGGQVLNSGQAPAAASPFSNFHGLTYSLDATYRLTPRLLFHVNGGKATLPSSRVDAAYSVNDTYLADVSYQMGRRFVLNLAVDNKSENFRGVSSNSPIQSFGLLRGSTTEVIGTATYYMNRRISLIFTLGDSERRATPVGFGYSSTIAGLTAKATF